MSSLSELHPCVHVRLYARLTTNAACTSCGIGLVGDDLWVLAICDCENGAAGDPKDLHAHHSRGSAQGNLPSLTFIRDGIWLEYCVED